MTAAVLVTVMVVEKEGVSVREPPNAANEFGQARGRHPLAWKDLRRMPSDGVPV